MVWLTALGLVTGLVMVMALLVVIIGNGIGVFWPKRVAQFEYRNADGTTLLAAGIVAKRQVRRGSHGGKDELQIFTGNKDVYGMVFRFIDADTIVKQDFPEGMVVLERVENGSAIGVLKSLKVKDEALIGAGDAGFEERLSALIAEANGRRDEIRHLEKDVIGANSKAIRRLQLDIKMAQEGARKSLQDQITTLEADYEKLAAQARELRAHQDDHELTFALASGETRTLPLGEIIRHHYANRLSWGERASLFAGNLWRFVWENPREANTEGGVFPAIFGTLVMTLLMSVVVVPVGVLAAVYLREYAKQGPFVRGVRIAVNNLAGVPSIVFGVFGLGFFIYFVGGSIDRLFFSAELPNPTFGTGGIFWSSLTLALMTVPVVIVATEEAIAAVPRGVREGSLACGASRWQTIQRIVIPAAVPGILTGLILAMARGAGEVAPLMLVGVVKLAPSLPLDFEAPFVHLDQKFMHLGFHIYDLGFQSPDSEAARPMVFATTLLLIALVLVLNMAAILLREHLRKRYASSAF
jgi:phosphate transport system permease protein